MAEFSHTSVLLREAVEGLAPIAGGLYIDGTAGGGGHSFAIAGKLSPAGRLICIDQDENALRKAKQVLAPYDGHVEFIHDNFAHIATIARRLSIAPGSVNGVLLDLGVSSHQLDEAERGFSYMHDAPLDMRMNRSDDTHPTAFDIVNHSREEELARILWDYGEERWAKRIAAFIVTERAQSPIQTTFDLVSVIKKAIPKGARQDGPHPAKRSFQAIRIAVNDELNILEGSIRDMTTLLAPGGRLCIITFHSLEDRIVKNTFRTLSDPCTCPRDFPVCVCGQKPSLRVITRKAVSPSAAELAANHRARSAKLRIAEKLGDMN